MNMPVKKIRDVAELVMGTSPRGLTYNDAAEGLPLLNGPTEFGESHPECSLYTTASVKECEAGDLLFCVRGSTTGRMNWADRTYSLGRGVCAIRGKTEMDTKFIRYCVDYRLSALLQLASGATFPNLAQETIKAFEIPFPSNRLEIASILSAYDDLIENNRRRMALLEKAARLHYEEWFVRLRFPGHERTLLIEGAPKGWERKRLGDLLTLKRGYDLPGGDRIEGEFPIVSSSGITGFHAEKKATAPGVVTGRYGTLGEVYFIQQDYWPLNTSLYVSDFKGNRPSFAAYLLKHALAGVQSDKAAVPGLNRNVAHQLPVLYPPKALRDRFADFADLGYRQQHVLEATGQKLRAARDFLLPRLMSGEIAV
jgi:type I restriction enzyme S subunit